LRAFWQYPNAINTITISVKVLKNQALTDFMF